MLQYCTLFGNLSNNMAANEYSVGKDKNDKNCLDQYSKLLTYHAKSSTNRTLFKLHL